VTEDLFTALKKKKKSELPKLEKVSTHFTASAPSKPLPKPQRGEIKRATQQSTTTQQLASTKPRYQRYQVKRQQAQAYQNEDFQFSTNVDQLGVNIFVRFQGTLIYTFLLPMTEYNLWQRMASSWAQRYEFIKMKVDPSCFMNDNQLVHTVIKTILNILDTLFREAQRVAAMDAQQQAQANTQAQQQQRAQRRRV
jgi:hypothetical protein